MNLWYDSICAFGNIYQPDEPIVTSIYTFPQSVIWTNFETIILPIYKSIIHSFVKNNNSDAKTGLLSFCFCPCGVCCLFCIVSIFCLQTFHAAWGLVTSFTYQGLVFEHGTLNRESVSDMDHWSQITLFPFSVEFWKVRRLALGIRMPCWVR